jgi:hypothetical protein
VPEHRGCAFRARERGEPLLGTASTVERWFLVEQPGPWGREALLESGVPLRVAEELRRRTREAGVRPLLIRRPDGSGATGRDAFLVTTRAGDRHVERLRFDDPADLLDVDLQAFREAAEPVGDPDADPLLLVCTNGRHDACCAVEGRPVARAAADVLGDAAWECSHVGGDRFAANVVWLPDGIYYGRVLPGEVAELVERFAERRLSLPHYRGRAPYPFAVQAAEVLARRELDASGIDAVTMVGHRRLDDERREVVFDVAGSAWRTVVRVGRRAEADLLTCGARRGARAPTYRLETIEPVVRRGTTGTGG